MSVLDDGERLTPADAAAWRAWLEDNHATAAGVWVLNVRGAGASMEYEDAVRQALCFGWIDGPTRTFSEGPHAGSNGQWFSPRRPSSGWATTNKARLASLEKDGLLAPAGIRAIEVAKANGTWEMLDGPEAGIEPDELTTALDAVPAARANWDGFPKSVKKLGLTHIATAKRAETRSARIAKIVADAAEGKRP